MFKFVILFSALLLSGCAAFFSVTGISQVFLGAIIPAIIMASSLEIGKLTAVSFVYRKWQEINLAQKIYMTSAAIILSIITSIGIYGYLAAAYSKGAVEFQGNKAQISMVEAQKQSVEDVINRNDNRITQLYNIRTLQEQRLDSLVGRTGFITQQRVIQGGDVELKNLQHENEELRKKADSLGNEIIVSNADLNSSSKLSSFSYFADQLGITLDAMIKWFILAIVLVFDPLALMLIIAYNSYAKASKVTSLQDIPPYRPEDAPETSDDPPITTEVDGEISKPLSPHQMPYYTDPDYDWNTDKRWLTDPYAAHYIRNARRIDK